jgi:hypothetical protein
MRRVWRTSCAMRLDAGRLATTHDDPADKIRALVKANVERRAFDICISPGASVPNWDRQT